MGKKPEWVKITEQQLKLYPKWRAIAAVEKEKLDELFPSCVSVYDEVVKSGDTAGTTEKYGIKRVEISEAAKKAHAIEEALTALKKNQKEIIERFYFNGEYTDDIILSMNIDDSTFRRWKHQAVRTIAEVLKII